MTPLQDWLAECGLDNVSFSVRAADGQELASHDAQRLRTAASTVKLLTVTSALKVLGPDHRFVTEVFRSGDRLYVRGGGDPWMQPQDLMRLARSVGVQPATQLWLDDTRYPEFTLPPGWSPEDLPVEVQPVAPMNLREYFGMDPAAAVAEALAGTLTELGTPVHFAGRAPASGEVVGRLESAPVRDLCVECLHASHNLIAEVLARETAIASGLDPTWADVPDAVLGPLGFPAVEVVDGSGLSTHDRVRVDVLTDVLVAGLQGPVHADAMLPLAGLTGTMSAINDWFQKDPGASVRGYIRAKSGTHARCVALAGITAYPGRPVRVFAIVADSLPGPRPNVSARRQIEEFAQIVATSV